VHKKSGVPALLAWPSPFRGGRALDEAARNAPSSAHRKLDEALLWLGASPGEGDLVVDLGAAPGGWSWSCLQRGARVIAVDRADLDDNVKSHPRLVHARKDAFTFVPDEVPTWLVCDVIAEPERSLEVIAHALTSTKLKALVVTVKLKRPVSMAVLARARALAQGRAGFHGRAKNLAANKCEISVMMKRVDV
jgi:23S rRNA (cytidine2498-2'-O)-methyltransferase